jgi:hypothetical protein
LPEPFEQLGGGTAALFHDARMAWLIDRLGGVAAQRVLERPSLFVVSTVERC